MALSSLLTLLAFVCAATAATIAPIDEANFVYLIMTRLNQEVSILHYNGVVQNTTIEDVVSAVISVGPANTPQEMIYDCEFKISKPTSDRPSSVKGFTCETFEVPYVEAEAAPGSAPAAPGGWSSIAINDNGVQGLFTHVNKMLAERNPPLQIVSINMAESQVVAGINYRLILQAGPNGSDIHVTHLCRVVVLVQEWMNRTEVTKVECDPITPVPYTGGWNNIDVNDAKVLNAANFAITALNGQCNCLFRKSFTNIVSASRQLVNGWKYKIVWKIGDSTCRNNEENANKDLTQCPLKSVNNVSTCQVIIWEQSQQIMPVYTLVRHNC